MANSRKPGPANPPMDWCLSPALTPGPLGLFDQGDPNATTLLGDTPGPLGMNDANDPSMSPFGSAMDHAMFISQDTIRRALENDSADARAAASAAAKPSSAAWERTEQSRVPAWNPAASDRVMGNLLANSERFVANKSSPGIWDRITGQGQAVLDATAEAVDDAGRMLLRAVTIDTPDEARERAERIELLRAQNIRKLLGAELLANGMIDNGMVCKRVGPMAVAVQPASAHPAYYDSFDQRIARSTADALELYASGALINAVAVPILTAGGKLTLRFLSAETKLSYGFRQELRSSLHADLRPSAKIDGLSPRMGGTKTDDVVAPKIAVDAGIEPVQASRVLDARGAQPAGPSVSQMGAEAAIPGGGGTTLAYRPVSSSTSPFLSSDGLARAGQARADLYQAWKTDNAAAYASVEEQVAGYRNLVSGESPWPEGFTPVNNTLPQGERIRMALSPGQPLSSPGGFATFDAIPNESYVRNELAVKYGWKNEIAGIVEYEVTQPLPIREGPVGPQIDLMTNRYLPGGGSQANLDIPRTQSRMDYLTVIKFTPFK